MTVVVDLQKIHLRLRHFAQKIVKTQTGMPAGKYIAGDETRMIVLLPVCARVKIRPSARFEQALELFHDGGVIRKMLDDAEHHDRVLLLIRLVGEKILVENPTRQIPAFDEIGEI